MSARHTPGPWVVEPDMFTEYQTEVCMEARLAFAGTRIANCEHNWNDADAGEHRISWAEAESNARLIAAAPELLAALEEILGRFNIQNGLSVRDEQAIKHAAAVIAKATGA